MYSKKPKIFSPHLEKSFAFRNTISSQLEFQELSTDVPMWLLDAAHTSLDFAYLAQQVVCGFCPRNRGNFYFMSSFDSVF